MDVNGAPAGPDGDDDPTELDAHAPPLRSRLEALLLVADQPTPEGVLASAAEATAGEVDAELREWRDELTAAGSGIDLRRSGEGWRLYTRRELAPYVERLLTDGVRSTLTRAALETLAVIAYRQPVTRSRIAAVRGVNVDGVMRTLVARGLAVECGTDSETGGMLYRTTELFLERLGLTSLDELPDIAPLLPDVDLVDEMSDDPADDPRIPLGRHRTATPEPAPWDGEET
ncbi:SMC-Scp complex subunit ScpB [Dietzia sp. ANT_WB102]|uniref:SMC-Scp complex subunit ScpB n=1 Tax=Dietzia sp. ANT_WB102 TaxID=2597345 RepID=UPI0011EE831B|nr:SMC-Scp complex subunit ScpB [Dietzia sp. ANT_WB102]KAA0920106.1 SMC-Scp complex subunit ScpB [Dietzia sp. ANT_WB102]